jgi:hypothetical protein
MTQSGVFTIFDIAQIVALGKTTDFISVAHLDTALAG